MREGLEPERIEALYIEACDLDVAAFKPGNVSVYSEGHGMTVADFLLSARVSAPWVAASGLPLGERIYRAVATTREAVGCNTNLGILLLAVPIAMAAERGGDLRRSLRELLAATTPEDTLWVYRAIRLANPGGLGRVGEGDVREAPPARPLLEVMALAADRDRIAWNYLHGFADLFDWAISEYHRALNCCRKATEAVTRLYLRFLVRQPDSLIGRKEGPRRAEALRRLFGIWLKGGRVPGRSGEAPPEGALERWDRLLKRRRLNPGTTADLVVATVFASGCLRALHHEAEGVDRSKGGGGHAAPTFEMEKEAK